MIIKTSKIRERIFNELLKQGFELNPDNVPGPVQDTGRILSKDLKPAGRGLKRTQYDDKFNKGDF